MSTTKIRSTFNQAVAHGRVGKADVRAMLESAIDRGGVTRTEAATLRSLRHERCDEFTRAALDAMDRFLDKMSRSWSPTKQRHLPHMTLAQLDDLLTADPRLGYYYARTMSSVAGSAGKGGGGSSSTGSSSGKGGGGSVSPPPSPPPAPVSSGKGGGGSVSPPRPPVSSGGKGGSYTPVARPVGSSGK